MDASLLVNALTDPAHPLRRSVLAELSSLPRAARHVLPAVVRAATRGKGTLLDATLENAKAAPAELAFEMDGEKLTWADVDRLTSDVAHVLSERGVKHGDVIAIVGRNSPLYVVLVLGATRVGATAALVNYHLTGAPLAHAVKVSKAKLVVVETPFVSAVGEVAGDVPRLAYGDAHQPLELAMKRAPKKPYAPANVKSGEDFVYIYTSGTTGLPKPCRVSHARGYIAANAFGHVLFGFRPGDKLYSPLPLYHASALLIGAGGCITTRTPMAIRATFSASAFLPDVRRYDASAMLYIGELCRYLVATPSSPDDRRHRVRVAVGNGLRPDVWGQFRDRFGIEEIREFYTATEAPGFLVNLGSVPGVVGRLPKRGLGWMKLARYDVDEDDHVRDAAGFCVEAAPDEPGELLIRIPARASIPGLDFRGYTDQKATSAKILTDVFKKGDRYFRSGDLLRQDALGFYAFVDRIGDTYRCKGENVSTSEVADVLSGAATVKEVAVVGVKVPPLDGQFGLAVVVPDGDLDLAAFARVAGSLPSYAQPRFVRVVSEMPATSTHKQQKALLRNQGVDLDQVRDPLFIQQGAGYVPFTRAMAEEIRTGDRRL